MFSGGFLACCGATIVLLQNSKKPCGCWTAPIVLLYNSNSLVWLPHSLCVVSTQGQVCGCGSGSGSGRHAAKSEAMGIYPHTPKIATPRCRGMTN